MVLSDMERKTLAITAPLFPLSTIFLHLRRALGLPKGFRLLLLLLCILLPLTTAEPCPVNGMQNSVEYAACGHSFNSRARFQDIFVGDDASSSYAAQSSATDPSIDSVCTDSQSFCFLSPLGISGSQSDSLFSPGLSINPTRSWSSGNWSSDYGMFELQNGRKISCSLNTGEGISLSSSFQSGSANGIYISSCNGPLLRNKDIDIRLNGKTGLDSFNVSSSLSVEITPPILDWGEKFLFFPSVAFLTVANKCYNSTLRVYQPFSTDKQFYPCNNYSDVLLLPGQAASICFMYLPRWLGLSSAHLVLQTNRGGFLILAKGFAVESPYGIQPLLSIDVPSNPESTKKVSLFNPLDETLFVEEITAWISCSSGNASCETEVTCMVENREYSYRSHRLLGLKDRLVVSSSNQGGFQTTALRPHNNWELGPHNRETIMEMDLLLNPQGKFSGALCVQVRRSSQEQTNTVMIPFEVDLDKKAASNDRLSPVSVFLQPLVPHDAPEMVLAISLENNAPYVLTVLGISQPAETKLFHIKHNEGLLLFPGTVTQVALISCPHMPSSDFDKSCIVIVSTNDSISPQIEFLCRDMYHICSGNRKESSVTSEQNIDSGDKKTGSLTSGRQLSSQFKAFEGARPDELILRNWKSQGSSSEMFVLKENELFFPVVEVGTHGSKWITVKNPSQEPVLMQLILNSGEIVDECRGQDGLFLPSSIVNLVQDKTTVPRKHGFSIAENAVSEAYVHPRTEATLGPISFHPSDRCRWISSALIRNNLSGVEWLTLKGFGGSLSLTILEDSKPIKSLEFYPNLQIPLNTSRLGTFFHIRETATACTRPLSKELYAKNTGDLRVEIKSITVSGTQCALDGFTVNKCKGFSLEPGELIRFLVSYQTDFSVSVLHRDLELALASGVLVIPMKSSIPDLMLDHCKKSAFWARLKKLLMAVLLIAALMFMVLYCVLPQVTAINFHYRLNENKKICNHKKCKVSISAEMDSLLRSIGDEKLERFVNGQDGGASENDNFKSTLQSGKAFASVSTANVSEPANNLTVKTGKDRKKRRKKKKGMVSGLMGLIEVSSSQSGNSTPTSPLSPLVSAKPSLSFKQSPEAYPSQETRNPFAQAAPPSKSASIPRLPEPNIPVVANWPVSTQPQTPKPVFSHSATFPARSVSSVRCSSPLAPHARAPGSRLCDDKPGELEKKTRIGNNAYTYDIWGDHLSALHLMERLKDVNGGKGSSFGEDESKSFFVKCPQSFLANTQPRYVSLFDGKV